MTSREQDEAYRIADRYLDFKFNCLHDYVDGDPDCGVLVLARSYRRLYEAMRHEWLTAHQNDKLESDKMCRFHSNPFLDLARFYEVDYGHVLSFADWCAEQAKLKSNGVVAYEPTNPWQMIADEALPSNVKDTIRAMMSLPPMARSEAGLVQGCILDPSAIIDGCALKDRAL